MFASVDFGLDSRSSCVIDFIKYHDNRQSTREIGKLSLTSGSPVTRRQKWQGPPGALGGQSGAPLPIGNKLATPRHQRSLFGKPSRGRVDSLGFRACS